MLLRFWFFRSVLGAALLAIGHAGAIKRAAHRVVAHAGQIFHTAAANQHNRVLLQVVALAPDVRRNFEAVRQAHTCHLAHGRIRLLRRRRVDASAYAPALRTGLERRDRAFLTLRLAWLPY